MISAAILKSLYKGYCCSHWFYIVFTQIWLRETVMLAIMYYMKNYKGKGIADDRFQ